MDIVESTQSYETWLSHHIPLIREDLALKHQLMRTGAFPFLRATFYRWVQLWPEICQELMDAPFVLSTGDLHIENYGTWRDIEGRLAWGINDFDEASVLPFPFDLVRLATSALVASREYVLAIHPSAACDAILMGYIKCLEKQGEPFVLAEHHEHLRGLAESRLKTPALFWEKFDSFPAQKQVPPAVLAILNAALPSPGLEFRIIHRTAGLGSLGRERYTALAIWRGGMIARELKRLLVSACFWQNEPEQTPPIYYQEILDHAVRSPDPITRQQDDWFIRRLAPDCCRIELSELPKQRDEAKLLEAMGWEAANVHLGSDDASSRGDVARRIHLDLELRPKDWLFKASQAMTQATFDDWEIFKRNPI